MWKAWVNGCRSMDFSQSLDNKIKYLRKIKTLIRQYTEEEFLIDFSDYKQVQPSKKSLTTILESKEIKNMISFLEINEAIALRVVDKRFK